MNKSITLYPNYIEQNVGMDGIVGNGAKVGGEDYRTVHANETMILGTVAFNSSAMQSLSAACILKQFDITFNQRCGANVVSGRELYWKFYPRYLFNVSYGSALSNGGAYLNSFSASSLNNSGVESKSNGKDYFSNDRTRTLYSGSYSSLFGDNRMLLGFYFTATNPAAANYKLYLKSLRANVTYEAKYYARFYDEDGKTLKKTETVAGGNRATPPSLSRTGHTVTWQQVGTNNTYSASSLPTSQDTDIAFKAVYTPVPKTVRIKETANGSCEVFKYVNGSWEKQNFSSYNSSGKYYEYSFRYGDGVTVTAKGCNQPSEDLVVKVYNTDNGNLISEQTIVPGVDRSTGITGTEADVYSAFALTDNIRIEVTPQTHYYTITTPTSVNGGSFTTTHRVARHGSSSVTVTPSVGFYITGITRDGASYAPEAGGTKTVVSFANVTADHSASATFARIPFNITFDLPAGVSVTANGSTVSSGTLQVNYGDTIALVFSCGSGLSLTGAFLDGSADSLMPDVIRQVQEFSFTLYNVTADHAVKVTTTDNLITIVEGAHEGGKIEGEFGTFLREKVTLKYTAIEDGVHHFQGWTGIDKTGTTITIEATDSLRSYTIGATFVTYVCEIYTEISGPSTLEEDEWGSVSPSAISIDSGESVTFTFTMPEGLKFEYQDPENDEYAIWFWSENHWIGLAYTKIDDQHYQFTIDNVAAGGRVDIDVFPKRFSLQADVVSPDGAKVGGVVYCGEPREYDTEYPSYKHNEQYSYDVTLTAEPTDGYRFVRWDNGDASRNRTIRMPAHAVYLTAYFRRLEHIVSLNVHEGGSALMESESNERSDGLSVRQWENVKLTVTADFGQKLKDVLLDGVSVFDEVTLTRRGGTYLLTNVTAAHTIEVIFAPRIYTNHRKLIDYYPPVIASIKDIQRLMAAYQISIDAMWDAISFLEENQFIETATDEGVSMWEKELGIIPAPTDTLNQRKARLRLKWVPSNNFTTKWLHGWLEDVCGTEVPWPELEGYTLHVTLPWFASWWTIFGDLKQYKPANIVLEQIVSLPEEKGNLYAGFAMQTEYEYEVDGEEAEPLIESEVTP